MDDIAQMAGVSKSTVSRALQDSDQVSERTKTKIRKLAYEHNYRLTSSVWEWRQDSVPNITLVLPTGRVHTERFSSPFKMEMVGAIADELTDRGYNTLLTKYPLAQDDAIQALLSAGPSEGLIIFGQLRSHHRLRAIAREIPNLVVWGGIVPDLNYCAVGTDNRRGGELATMHLLKLGRKRVAFFGDTSALETKLRYQGYKDAHKKLGHTVDSALLVETPYNQLSAYTQLQTRLEAGINFDAIFASSDVIAMSLMRGLSEAGISVPEDVSIVGYDDVSAAKLFGPPLTTIHQSIHQASAILVDSLLKLTAGEQVSSTLLPAELIVRESCGSKLKSDS
ncbi:MAG: LacI family DNA-binding transcriptional regulator [Henriciella sp.]|nr:LacI family DNA-binding transcriptional regulator [Henriciella sp.]